MFHKGRPSDFHVALDWLPGVKGRLLLAEDPTHLGLTAI